MNNTPFFHLSSWSHRFRFLSNTSRRVSFGLTFLAILFGTITFGMLSGFSVFGIRPKYLLAILGIDIVIFLALGLLIARKLVALWAERRRGLVGSKIHVRLTLLFGALAVTPAIIMTVFSVTFFHFGLQEWFSERVRGALRESVEVSKSYLSEHRSLVAKDASLMLYDLMRELPTLSQNKEMFNQYLTAMSGLRSLTEAIVFDPEYNVIARSDTTFALQFESFPEWARVQADKGQVVLLNSQYHNRIRALVHLPGTTYYLYVGRTVDPSVLRHLEKSETIFKEYSLLEGQRTGFELIVISLFAVVALLLLLVAIWVGLSMAGTFMKPVRNLMKASEKIRQGDLSARVPETKKAKGKDDEIDLLIRSFNRMTKQLNAQQTQLREAYEKLDERHRFITSTLAGVSAGVVGLDVAGNIIYPNERASFLLGMDLNQKIGKKFVHAVPKLKTVVKEALEQRLPIFKKQVSYIKEGVQLTYLFHCVVEESQGQIKGYVVTLEDVTDVIAAEKQLVWSDVARRVAHEIKNPLTPIHLSAERLKRKYLKEIKTTPQVFLECVDTITRQVTYIGHMVTEFSAFARMPVPVFQRHDLRAMVQHVYFMQENAYKNITFKLKIPDHALPILCDEQQISQALINVIKNAAESLLESDLPIERPVITITAKEDEKNCIIEIRDNGSGFPAEDNRQLIDPYVTTRTKGTGLGLAIVQRIMEDHNGQLVLSNRPQGGALVTLIFSKNLSQTRTL